jgi:hypothetical protein
MFLYAVKVRVQFYMRVQNNNMNKHQKYLNSDW